MAGRERTSRCTDGVLNYLDEAALARVPGPLEFHVPHEHRTTMRLRGHTIPIIDARPDAADLSLEREGFCLAEHRLALHDAADAAGHNGANLHEVTEVVRQAAGGAQAMCIGIQLRFAETSPRAGTGFNTLPARFVHGDFKGDAGLGLFTLWPGFEPRDHARLAIFNAWRVITPPPQDTPLAVCDARTVRVEESHDLTAVLEEEPGTVQRHHIAGYRYSPRHRWSYFSEMTPDELLIFKTFETDPARPYAVPHSAFDDATFAGRAVPRASAEARVLVAFD